MKISIIVAMDQKRGIGKNGKIPWHIRDDLIKLKKLTKDHIVILGRITYDSMVWYYNKSGKPMPGRLYIVITRDEKYKPARDNATVAHSLEEALKIVKENEVFIIGGGQIFQQALPLADKLYLTIVKGDYDCDATRGEYLVGSAAGGF